MRRSVILAVISLTLSGAGCKRLASLAGGRHPGGEFRSDEGRYTVVFPAGKFAHKEWTDNGVRWFSDVVGNKTGAYGVIYADIPPGGRFDVEAGVAAATQGMGCRSYRLDGGRGGTADDWRDFEIEGMQEEYTSGRALWVRGRVHLISAVGPTARRTSPEVQALVDSFRLTDGELPWASIKSTPFQEIQRRPATPAPALPPPGGPTWSSPPPAQSPGPPPSPEGIYGGDFDPVFRDTAPAGGYLVGFDVGNRRYANYHVVGTLRPIYGAAGRYELGQQHGPDVDRPTRVLAKPGYAVGGLSVTYGGAVDGFQVIFMKAGPDRLDPTDSYASEWVGGPGGYGPVKLGGTGSPVVGIIGKKNAAGLSGIGLVLGTAGGP